MKRNIIFGVMIAALFILTFADKSFAKSRSVRIDGSSTVYPISEAVAEEYRYEDRKLRVTVGVSGTGGGFKRFCAGDIDINDASRAIKKSEIAKCKANGVEYIELPIAYDGLAIVVNPQNKFLKSITVKELKKMWEPKAQKTITSWKQINPVWSDVPLSLFGPGVDSGTYDYFTKAVTGKEGFSRGDYTASEDDNILVQGIAGDKNGLGFMGLAYYENNKSRLKLVPVDAEKGKGAILPTVDTVKNGTYSPLSRPVFIYVRKDSLNNVDVKKFVDFYLNIVGELALEVGYIPMSDKAYSLVKKRVNKRTTGTLFSGKGNLDIEKTLSGK